MSLTYFTKFVTTETGSTNELWIADATGATSKIADIGFFDGFPAAEPASLAPAQTALANAGGLFNALTIGNKIYFSTYNPDTGTELWSSDGTAAGTGPIADIAPGPMSSYPNQLTYFNGEIYFTAYDSVHGTELWKTDGTAAGTVLVTDINLQAGGSVGNTLANGLDEPISNAGSNPYELTSYNGALYFLANNGIDGYQLWKTDGTSAGTVAVTSSANGLNPGSQIVISNGLMYFAADDGLNGYELYVSDGTDVGTVMLTNFAPGGEAFYSSYPSNLTSIDGVLFFTTQDEFGQTNLWRTNGTIADTIQLTELSGYYGYIQGIIKAGDVIYFAHYDGQTGVHSLWKTDGTPGGTVAVIDGLDSAHSLTAVNGTLYFVAYDLDFGYEIWTSDGTAGGTVRVTDIYDGPNGSNPNSLRSVNGQLQFTAYDGTSYNLYAFDGTTTTLIATDVSDFTTTAPVAPTADLNGDETSDILWFNATNGYVNSFEMQGGTPTWESYGQINPGWDAAGTGDFNGDGTKDILFRRATDGAIGEFITAPDGSYTWKGMGLVDASWSIAAVADLDNDGTDDIVYTDAAGSLGYLQIHNGTGSWHGLGFVDPAWQIAATGDINGDGTADLVYANATNGSLNALTLAPGTLTPSWSAIAVLTSGTNVAGLGDFNGDGTNDILLYNGSNNGALSYLEMHNGIGTLTSFTGISAIGSDWTVAAIGDYNNDGLSDIVFYNDTLDAAGLLSINPIGGPTWTGLGAIDSNWKVV